MCGYTDYRIIVTEKEAKVVKELMTTLAECPFDLGNDDYFNIFSEIAEHHNDLDEISGHTVSVVYEEDDICE